MELLASLVFCACAGRLETTARYSMKRCQGRTSSRIGLPRGIDEDETSDVVEVARDCESRD